MRTPLMIVFLGILIFLLGVPDSGTAAEREPMGLQLGSAEYIDGIFTPIGVSLGRSAKYEEHVRAIESKVGQGRHDEAIIELQFALDAFPDDAHLMSRAVALYIESGKYRSAEVFASRLVAQYPEVPHHRVLWGGALLRLREMERAEEVLRSVLDLDPENLVARYHMACVRAAGGDYDAVVRALGFLTLAEIRTLARWLSLEWDILRPVIGEVGYQKMVLAVLTGGEHESLGRSAGADAVREDMLVYSPAGIAVEELYATPANRLIRQHPMRLRQRLSEVYGLLLNLERAIYGGQWQAAAELAHSPELARTGLQSSSVRMFSAYSHLRLGHAEEALRRMRAIIDERPEIPQLRHYLGSILLEEERWQEAETMLRESVELFPDDDVLAELLAEAVTRRQEYEKMAGAFNGVAPPGFEELLLIHIPGSNPPIIWNP